MHRNHILFLIFTILIGAIAAAQAFTTLPVPDGVSCAGKRIASFGFTHKQLAMAELAAIITWQKETKEKVPGFSQWHLSFKRTMRCRKFKDSAHFQCTVSALPCRIDRT